MESIILERTFDAAADLDAMELTTRAIAWCYEQRSVTFVHSYASSDLRRFVCLYRAPDAEAVRVVQRTGKFPYDRAWPAQLIGPETVDVVDCIVVERVLEAPITATDAAAALGAHVVSHLSRDGLRLTSIHAPGATVSAFAPPVVSEHRWAAKRLWSP